MLCNAEFSWLQLKNYKNQKKLFGRETSKLVTLINGLNQNIGLPSYTTIHKVSRIFNIAIICFIMTCILQVIALFNAKDDPKRLFECSSILAFSGMGVFKLVSLQYSHNRWKFILKQISVLENEQLNSIITSDADYQSDDEEAIVFSKFVNNYTGKFKITFSILRKIYLFTAAIFILSPFLERLFCTLRGLECRGNLHILPGWAPLDDLSIFGYLFTILCEFIAAVYCVLVHITFDLTAIAIMMFVCGQFSLLNNYSANIGGNGKLCRLSKQQDDRARFRIRHCHHINVILINLITGLDKLLKNIIGVYVLLATLTLCFVALQLKSEDMSVMQWLSLFQYMCGTLTQLFLFCWYGDAVLNESSVGMGQGPFAAAHWCLSPSIRRDLSILGIGMMRKRHLRAGPFNFLDLPLFVQIVRTAYSCYAVLGKKNV